MKIWHFLLAFLLSISGNAFASCNSCCDLETQGWSIDVGGQYTWMHLTGSPGFDNSCNTCGAQAKITYQMPEVIFVQARSVYNIGMTFKDWKIDYESYTEFVGGYCISFSRHWIINPYIGLGFDLLSEKFSDIDFVDPAELHYHTYYVIVGLDLRYIYKNWSFGARADCFPILEQCLTKTNWPSVSVNLHERVGFDVHLPIAYKIMKNVWLEMDPYYRLLPVGASSVLQSYQKNLSQWGIFATFRFYI